MQVVRQIVDRKSITSVHVPEEFGDRVEIIVLSLCQDADDAVSSYPLHALQAESGFVREMLASEEEDVWNDI